MHQAGASALTELLQFSAPDQRAIPCPCGQPALYRESRSKTVLTVVGPVQRESNRWRVRLLYITTTDGCVPLTVGIIAGVFAFAWIGVTQGTLVSKGFLQAIENVGTLLRALHLI